MTESTSRLEANSRPANCPAAVWELYCAAANGTLETVRRILRNSPDSMHHHVWYECPLHFATRENQIEIIQALLDADINPAFSNWTYSSWPSLLAITTEREFDEIHAMLVAEMRQRFNYDPDYKPLWDAIVSGDLQQIEQLTKAQPHLINGADEHGNRAIHWAVLARRIPIIELLLAAGADINAKRADLQTPLHLALENDYWFGKTNQSDPDTSLDEVAEFLRDQNADYEFNAAVAFGDLEHVKSELAKTPALASTLSDSRRSPLYMAAKRGHLEIVKLLLDHGADPNAAEHCAVSGRALFEASARNDIEMMQLLLQHGANADAYVDSCGNCLSIAEQGGPREAEALELLRQHGAQPGEWTLDSVDKIREAISNDESFVPNRDSWSSILNSILKHDDVGLVRAYVARFGKEDVRHLHPNQGWRVPASEAMLAELLSHGMNINARDGYGRTFLHYAALDDTPDRVGWLLDAGAEIDAIDHQSGTTPLGLAAWNGTLPIVDLLLKRGADSHIPRDTEWAKPMSFAKKQGHDEIVQRLSKA